MLRSISILSTIFLLLSSMQAVAQDTLTFLVKEQFVADETQISVPFSATHFDQISYFQLSVHWDSSRLSFNSIDDINLGGLVPENFSINQVSSGKFGMNWIDPNTQSTTLQDTTRLFNITFDIISDDRSSTEIIFGNDPTDQEAGDVNGSETPLKGIGAAITFEQQSTSVKNILEEYGIRVEQNSPNPFKEETLINFEIAKSEEVLLEVFDLEGRRLIRTKSQFPRGNNHIKLNKRQLNGSGVYQYSLTIKQKTITKKLILLN